MNKLERYLPAPQVLLAFFAGFVFMVLTGPPVYSDHDVLWHIAAGDLIRQMGAIPKHDPWSFTAGEQPWYIISWLFDVALSYIHEWGGIKAVYIAPFIVLAFLLAFLIRGILQRGVTNSDVLVLISICAMIALSSFGTSRPHIVAFVLAAITHQILHANRGADGYGKLLWLPFIMCIWVNVHGSFVVGLSLLGAYGLEAMIHKKWDWFRRMFIIGIACVFALFINPYGLDMHTAMNRTLDSVITPFILEWLPFVFSNYMGLSAWVLLFIATSNFRENTILIADKIIVAIWFVFMLFSMRHAGMFIVVSAPYLAISIQRFVEYLEPIVTKHPDLMESLGKPGMQWKLALLSLAAVILSYAGLDSIKDEGYKVNKAQDYTPAISYLEEHYPSKRFLNDYDLGGQLVYQSRGRVPLFVDGRAGTAYSEELLEDYIDFLWIRKDWEKIIDKYKIDGIIVANTHRFAMAYESGQFHDEWKEVFRDEVASVYVKNPPKNK